VAEAKTMSTSSIETTQLSLVERYQSVRQFSEQITEPLSPEDCMVQSMPDTSPTRWHLAHTTWFFETFILEKQPAYCQFDEEFSFLFNSYYNTVGEQFPRPQRGLISRPGLEKIWQYRHYVDERMAELLETDLPVELLPVMEVGLQHEQQHQELMLTDIKHVLSCNPMLPVYHPGGFGHSFGDEAAWFHFDGGLVESGHDGNGFGYDNEFPRHKNYLQDFSLAGTPVTCGQFIEFIEDGGYERPDHWLSLGWTAVEEEDWKAPLYWLKRDGYWMQYTLAGLQLVNPHWPVCHVSYFEADAFARWAGYRLPTEFEWERACEGCSGDQFADHLMKLGFAVHPTGERSSDELPSQMLGGVWEWTSSSYSAYPGYQPPEGALGEYNGKFMCNQYVLRGGSVATSSNHIRPTYRNFFPPEARWQFSGFRLAK
jgi:ergothioneine biosynthesis protein EgtB